jgi:Fe-S cluster biogenesis protein NfuA
MMNPVVSSADLTELRERIEQSLDTVRPALQMDGGDVEFVEFDPESGIVQLRLVGVCGICPISPTTVKHGIERRLREMVPEVREVRAF